MLKAIKRWFRRPRGVNAPGVEIWLDWTERRGLTLRPVRNQVGVVVEGGSGGAAWRLEWGPSRRPYWKGFELRLRGELASRPELQLLILSRSLRDWMERTVFDQYVESVQTRMDAGTPPEMRWLVMYAPLEASDLGRLSEGFAAVGNHRDWLLDWLRGPLSSALASPSLPLEQAMVMTISRGHLVLRVPMELPDEIFLDGWLRLFEIAHREAARVAAGPLGQTPPEPQG